MRVMEFQGRQKMMQTTTHPYDNCCFKTSSITGESSVDHNHNQSHRSLGCSKPSLDIVSREWWRSLSLDCNTRLLALRVRGRRISSLLPLLEEGMITVLCGVLI
ncbi:uncharacterized protein LOC143470546 isoform X2 [Clavelina lepadiformis]|uniref:uncharacterized protein LOC143470546 isoform X2 n=1 Tax=Clavelina lepadiformis TaxID=159417 RepID=UPI0040422A8C